MKKSYIYSCATVYVSVSIARVVSVSVPVLEHWMGHKFHFIYILCVRFLSMRKRYTDTQRLRFASVAASKWAKKSICCSILWQQLLPTFFSSQPKGAKETSRCLSVCPCVLNQLVSHRYTCALSLLLLLLLHLYLCLIVFFASLFYKQKFFSFCRHWRRLRRGRALRYNALPAAFVTRLPSNSMAHWKMGLVAKRGRGTWGLTVWLFRAKNAASRKVIWWEKYF